MKYFLGSVILVLFISQTLSAKTEETIPGALKDNVANANFNQSVHLSDSEVPPGGNILPQPLPSQGTNTTTATPPPKPTSTTSSPNTTISPSTTTISPNTTITPSPTPSSTTIAPNSTTSEPTTISPTKPPSTVAPTESPRTDRKFDGLSFFAGIVLSAGLLAIGVVAYKFYEARRERNYHTL